MHRDGHVLLRPHGVGWHLLERQFEDNMKDGSNESACGTSIIFTFRANQRINASLALANQSLKPTGPENVHDKRPFHNRMWGITDKQYTIFAAASFLNAEQHTG